ncbi:hypothetical protein JL100_025825 [Skermanella mucosa]|uniref:hypothetical protein n=1 Tax=Skermanella mucosa TaxID=1789672 RepID=UPI00192BFB43|nr:hypothetical protein [Skermanella mucosa]UEM20458.1 hypothetical protein JL100_025825 [Skermanella mucosa]
MKLADIKKSNSQFIRELQAARANASSEIHVNSGVRTAADISSVINNRITEKPDWQLLYQYAMQLD